MIDYIQDWLDSAAKNATSLGIIGGGIAALLALRGKVCKCFRGFCSWITAPSRIEPLMTQIVLKLESLIEENVKIKKSMYNGGENGLVHNLDLVKALSRSNFEAEPMPMYVCHKDGGNLSVNAAYRILARVWRDDEIGGTQWHQLLTGSMKQSYIEGFDYHSARGEDFIGDCEIQNPLTNESRGMWKIHSVASKKTDGGLIYVGRFVAALDDVATSIAEEHKWTCRKLGR